MTSARAPGTEPWIASALDRVPELAPLLHADERDLPYRVFRALASFVSEEIRGAGSADAIRRSFELIDDMAAADTELVDNLLVVAFFEVLADHQVCRAAALAQLGPRACELLRVATAFWRR